MDYGTVMLLEDSPNIKVSVYDFSKLFAIFSFLLTYPFLFAIKVLQNRGLLYYEIDDIENALQDFLAASKVQVQFLLYHYSQNSQNYLTFCKIS